MMLGSASVVLRHAVMMLGEPTMMASEPLPPRQTMQIAHVLMVPRELSMMMRHVSVMGVLAKMLVRFV